MRYLLIGWGTHNNNVLGRQDPGGQVRGVAVRDLRGAVHHPAHPHHRGQLQQVSISCYLPMFVLDIYPF